MSAADSTDSAKSRQVRVVHVTGTMSGYKEDRIQPLVLTEDQRVISANYWRASSSNHEQLDIVLEEDVPEGP